MRNKNKIHFYYFIILGLVFVASFFIWKKTSASEPDLKITNIQFSGGAGKTAEDFIEITNTTNEEINLNDYRLVKKTSSGKIYNLKSFSAKDSVSSEGVFIWASSKIGEFPESVQANVSTKETISKGNGIAIILGSAKNGTIIDSINWEENENSNNSDSDNDLSGDSEEKKDYSGISINEIYPAPDTKAGEEEFVEIKNTGKENFNFSNWKIIDEKNNKGKISKSEKKDKFYIFYGKFSLNNDSDGDTVFLYDENGNLVASQKYSNGKSQYSYSSSGTNWRWTSIATPGEENVFDKILSGKIIRDKKVYKNIYAYFKVKTDKDTQKFTWDFGDGHKSYLKETKHKYEKTGKFQASLKLSGNGEDKIYTFEVKVEKYDAPKVRITSLSANPHGSDTKNEYLVLENKSKDKVNLKDWSVATGWKKLINHPIRENFEIKAGKTKKLLRDICAFTLVNTKDKIELRSPDGKAVQKIKYDHDEKSIAEDELYSKVDGKWQWIPLSPFPILEKEAKNEVKVVIKDYEENFLGLSHSEIQANLGKYTTNPAWQNKQKYRLILAYSSPGIIFPEKFLSKNTRVLGAQTTKTEGNFYIFTWNEHQKHWFLTFFDSNWIKLNSKLNSFLNKISS